MGEASTTSDRGQPYAPAALLGLALFALLAWRLDFVCDDAYITFRYARNWAEGHGLVYHVGADAPVEGYTEFLWAIAMGVGMKLGVAPELLSRVLSLGAGAALVVLVARLAATRFAPTLRGTLLATVFAATAPPIAAWATGGMATMPAAFFGVALFAAAVPGPGPGRGGSPRRRMVLASALAVALALVRADGAVVVALVLGPAIAASLASRAARRGAAVPLVAALVSALAFGAHVAWRWSVYGDWLPNTARVKFGFSARAFERGLDYVVSNHIALPGLFLASALALVGVVAHRRALGAPAVASTVALVLGVPAYAAATGGDFMCFARFLVPGVPFVALGFGAALHGLRPAIAWPVGLAAIALCAPAIFGVEPLPGALRERFVFRYNQQLGDVPVTRTELEQWKGMRERAADWAVMGRALREHAPEGASLVYGAVGAIGYFSGLFIHDTNGLVTREVALRDAGEGLRSPGHDKAVPPEFFLRQDPTWLRIGLGRGDDPRAVAASGLEVIGPTERPGILLFGQPPPR